MKKRAAGGVILVAIGIGIWLSNLFNGLGPGGSGTNVGMNPETVVSLQESDMSGARREGETGAASATNIPSPPVVVIDEQQYFLEQRSGDALEYVPTNLDRIVELAHSAEPDEHGIRVHIKRRGSSRPSAETALSTALRNAGVTEQQIQLHKKFVK